MTKFDPQILRRIADSLGVPRDVELECKFDDVMKFGHLSLSRASVRVTTTIAGETIGEVANAIQRVLRDNPWIAEP